MLDRELSKKISVAVEQSENSVIANKDSKNSLFSTEKVLVRDAMEQKNYPLLGLINKSTNSLPFSDLNQARRN